METGAILSKREAEAIRKRLTKIGGLTRDRRILEHCRLIACAVNRGGRRVPPAKRPDDPILF